MTDAPETTGPLGELFAHARETTELAESFYAMLKKRGEVKSHRVLTYRCPKRCLLADVLATNKGHIVHSPAYKLSPSVNLETSTEAGRSKNTIDGDRRWKATTYFTSQAANIICNCDHVNGKILEFDKINADLDSGIREVVLS